MDIIHYEPHPVSPERKNELRAKGLRIVDIVFKPVSELDDPKPKSGKADSSKPKDVEPKGGKGS